MPPFGGLAASGLRGFGVEPDHRFLDESVDLGPRTRTRDRSQMPVHMRGTSLRQTGGLFRDPASPPQRQLPSDHSPPKLREPVAQLQDPTDLSEPGLGGDPERRGVLHQRELRDQRRTHPSHREGLVGKQPHTLARIRLVQHRPLDCQLGLLDLDPGDLRSLLAQPVEHCSGAARGLARGAGHRTIQAPTTDSHGPSRTGFPHTPQGFRGSSLTLLTPQPPEFPVVEVRAREPRNHVTTGFQTSSDRAGARSPRGSTTTSSSPSQPANRRSSAANSSGVSEGAPSSA